MNVLFTQKGWEDYLYWQQNDLKMLDRVNALLKDCARSPFGGIGKPEPLRHDKSGWWSRRVTDHHRLVYRIKGGNLEIAQCRFHYEK